MSRRAVNLRNIRHTWLIFILLLPTVGGVALFRYVPAIEAVRHAFYNWDGAFTEEYVGFDNFRKLLGNLSLWGPLLLGAALAGFAGLSAEKRRVYRILHALALAVLGWAAVRFALDVPRLPETANPAPAAILLGLGLLCWLPVWFHKQGRLRAAAHLFAFLLPIAAGFTYLIGVRSSGDQLMWRSFRLILILIAANLLKMWPSIFTAVCIHRLRSERWQYAYRVLFVVPMIIPMLVALLIWKFFYDPNVGALNTLLTASGLDNVLIWLDKWVLHLGVFVEPFKPAWLGNPDLIIPALVFWGFPWVGVVGVLIYLAGLQNIGDDVYEAADLDGISWWGKFWRIELPLIMTQV
ncbi:MAG: sugar ABC transporter permease, partial [Lentisphaerae bacterium]|nr:sugar ABC transporter permease [Lentisphaerota bacterium]